MSNIDSETIIMKNELPKSPAFLAGATTFKRLVWRRVIKVDLNLMFLSVTKY